MSEFDDLMKQAREYLDDPVFNDYQKAAELFIEAQKIAPDPAGEEKATKGRMEALFRAYSKTRKDS